MTIRALTTKKGRTNVEVNQVVFHCEELILIGRTCNNADMQYIGMYY